MWAANYLIKQAFGQRVGGATDSMLTPGMGPRVEMRDGSVAPRSPTAATVSQSPIDGYQRLGGHGPGTPGAPGSAAANLQSGLGGLAEGFAKDVGSYWLMGKMMGGGGKPAAETAGKQVAGAAGKQVAGAAGKQVAGATGKQVAGAAGRAAAGRAAGWGGKALGWGGKALGWGSKLLGAAGPIGWAYTLGDLAATGGNMYYDQQEANTRQQQAQGTAKAIQSRNAEILSGKHDWRYTTPAQRQQLAATKARFRSQPIRG
jgi:hypothetical protein